MLAVRRPLTSIHFHRPRKKKKNRDSFVVESAFVVMHTHIPPQKKKKIDSLTIPPTRFCLPLKTFQPCDSKLMGMMTNGHPIRDIIKQNGGTRSISEISLPGL